MAQNVTRNLRRIECDPLCGFVLQDHNENELIDVTIRHVRTEHGKTLTPADVRATWKTLG
ncbi:MAG TPA: hypothetical protein VM582_04535 [Candidatus Thermoplasmatota archaeon]|nr:hypothetical protein [Candidatus Thermoplasmatota archaeon]